jgi:acetyltransferase-like isoleucine patch superfamily enzyme
MRHINKLMYFIHILTKNPWDLFRLFNVGITTIKFRYLIRCVGKGTIVEPNLRIINSANVLIGNHCLLKENIYLRAGTEGKVVIKDRAAINSFCQIYGHGDVEIGEGTEIGPGVLITTTDHDYHDELRTRFKPVLIGRNVWIGANVTILPGIKIGDNAVIGAGAVVTKDIPSYSVAVGIPAKVIKNIKKHLKPVQILSEFDAS